MRSTSAANVVALPRECVGTPNLLDSQATPAKDGDGAPLNARRAAFAQAYVYGPESVGNAAASARAAGYSDLASRSVGQRMLTFADVAAEIARLTAERDAAIKAEGIARKERRLALYNQLVDDLLTVKGERGTDPRYTAAAGGSTGMVVRREKRKAGLALGGDDEKTVAPIVDVEEELDTGWATTLLNTLKQAAIEIGDWEEKKAVGGEVLIREYVGVEVRRHVELPSG